MEPQTEARPVVVVCLQVHRILSSVNARLQQAAAAHPSRMQASPAVPHSGSSGGGDGSTPAAAAAAASLVELLQQLTESVVGLVEGLAVEKECLESEMLHANDEARQLRGQVGNWRVLTGTGRHWLLMGCQSWPGRPLSCS